MLDKYLKIKKPRSKQPEDPKGLLNIFSICEKILILKTQKKKMFWKKHFVQKIFLKNILNLKKCVFYFFDTGRQSDFYFGGGCGGWGSVGVMKTEMDKKSKV